MLGQASGDGGGGGSGGGGGGGGGSAAGGGLYTASFVADYLDSVESLPFDLQRNVTLMREIDVKYQEVLREVEDCFARYEAEAEGGPRARALQMLQVALVRARELGDEKLAIVSMVSDAAESRWRQAEALARLADQEETAAAVAAAVAAGETAPGTAATPTAGVTRRDKAGDAAATAAAAAGIGGAGGRHENNQHPHTHAQNHFNNHHTSHHPNHAATTAAAAGGGGGGTGGGAGSGGGTPVLEKGAGKRSHRQRSKETLENSLAANGAEAAQLDEAPKPKKARSTGGGGGKKKKKRSSVGRGGGKTEPHSPPELDLSTVDPDEPTYCLCNQVSYGDMIGCDNEACAIEWFHFGCVGLSHKPKGKWFCPRCRGPNERTMDRALLERARKERGCASAKKVDGGVVSAVGRPPARHVT
ncbi:inhibitor of growth protein 1 [Lampetra fluviatilis]